MFAAWANAGLGPLALGSFSGNKLEFAPMHRPWWPMPGPPGFASWLLYCVYFLWLLYQITTNWVA